MSAEPISAEKAASDGYVAEIAYTFGYQRALNPLHMRLPLLQASLAVPDVTTACELGCGQGLSLAVHAAASPTQWLATDVNPDHVASARHLLEEAGAKARVFTDSFAAFAGRSDLPDFDFIAMHGVWSWISDRNRAAIVQFVRRRLKPGGVFYLSYNALPGSTVSEPIRHLLVEHAKLAANRERGIVERIDGALDFADKLLEAKPGFTADTPAAVGRLRELMTDDRRYLAHEYFNQEWQPMHFAAMAPWLAGADLQYACSASYFDAIEALNLNAAQRALIGQLGDPGFRQTVRDFLINRRFRPDYWIKQPQRLSAAARDDVLRRERVVLVAPQAVLPFKVRAVLALNRVDPGEATIAAVLRLLAGRRPMTVGEMERSLSGGSATLSQILESLMVLVAYELIAPAQDADSVPRAKPQSDRLNARLLATMRTTGEIKHLASPVTGGGIELRRRQRRFLLAWLDGRRHPDQWVKEAATAGEDIDELTKDAREFFEHGLPTLRALQVVS